MQHRPIPKPEPYHIYYDFQHKPSYHIVHQQSAYQQSAPRQRSVNYHTHSYQLNAYMPYHTYARRRPSKLISSQLVSNGFLKVNLLTQKDLLRNGYLKFNKHSSSMEKNNTAKKKQYMVHQQ